jgi:phosphomannomutase
MIMPAWPATQISSARSSLIAFLAGDEIAHLRASGNAPELRGYAEAGEPSRASEIVARLLTAAAARL